MLQPTDAEREEVVRQVFGQNLAQHSNSCKFSAYFRHYYSVVCPASSGDAVIELDTNLLQSHADVIKCIQALVRDPTMTLDAFIVAITDQKSAAAVSVREKQHIARIIVEVLFSIDCMSKDYYFPNERGPSPQQIKWEGDTTFLSFIQQSFRPKTGQKGHQPLNKTQIKSLKGWKLVKRYGIKIRGTNNLLEHLDLNTNTMTLKVFHQVSFLRAHLTKTKDEPLDLSFEESIKR